MDNLLNPANAHKQRCPRCQSPLNTVVVHGHEQCVVCKSNIFECCSGDTCETDYNLSVGYLSACALIADKAVNIIATVIVLSILIPFFGRLPRNKTRFRS